jgi:hypothetical protein
VRTYLALSCLLISSGACGPGSGDDEDSKGSLSAAAESTGTGGDTGSQPTTEAPTTSEETGGPTSGGTSTETTDATTGPQVCTAPPLTEEQIGKLGFGPFGNEFSAQPGNVLALKLGTLECCVVLEPVEACVEYSLSPTEGATYDAATGELTIGEDAVAGTIYTLTADVEDGRATLEAKVTVYTKESHPMVGIWHEVGQTPCEGGAETLPAPGIGELWFKANGEVLVTWQPFEVYVDYWGTYTFDLATGAISIAVDGGNYVPPDVDGEGTFEISGDGSLVLSDMWLGSAQDFMGEPACGQRFE